jgi:hypothetical protein
MMWRCAVILTLTFCAATGACRARDLPPKPESPTADDQQSAQVRGWLDRVEGKARIGGTVEVIGWAGAERPENRIQDVEILLDGMEIAETAEGIERSDVADRFGKPDWSNSGWEVEIALDEILPGEHKIEAVARDSSGARYALLGGRSIVVLDSR